MNSQVKAVDRNYLACEINQNNIHKLQQKTHLVMQ